MGTGEEPLERVGIRESWKQNPMVEGTLKKIEKTFGRKQLLLRFSTMHFSVYESIYPRLNLESSQTSLCLAVILMYIYSFWDGLY